MHNATQPATLRDQIGQLLIVGFRGCELRADDPIVRDVRERHLGGVILFDQEMADTGLKERNVRSPEQVRELVAFLQRQAATPVVSGSQVRPGGTNVGVSSSYQASAPCLSKIAAARSTIAGVSVDVPHARQASAGIGTPHAR